MKRQEQEEKQRKINQSLALGGGGGSPLERGRTCSNGILGSAWSATESARVPTCSKGPSHESARASADTYSSSHESASMYQTKSRIHESANGSIGERVFTLHSPHVSLNMLDTKKLFNKLVKYKYIKSYIIYNII